MEQTSQSRVIVIVLDSVGIGALPDAEKFGDNGAHTLRHVAASVGDLKIPTLEKLGLGCIDLLPGVSCPSKPLGFFGKMAELSPAKDTLTGHFEMMGCVLQKGFKTYPEGFPQALIDAFCNEGQLKGVIGNIPASGTEIIQKLGKEHVETGFPIVYTSADSVFQIAAHEEILPPRALYRLCEIARKLCDAYDIGRVIARPFIGKPGNFERTKARRDYAALPPQKTLLEYCEERGISVIGIGKIPDIFSDRGISESLRTKDNKTGMETLNQVLDEGKEPAFVFVNLVDFDMLYGHRRDPKGYAKCLESFDVDLEKILLKLKSSDFIFISADHGCDPTYPGTDHTREYVPLLCYSPSLSGGKSLGVRNSFADLGATTAELLGFSPKEGSFLAGKSFAALLKAVP